MLTTAVRWRGRVHCRARAPPVQQHDGRNADGAPRAPPARDYRAAAAEKTPPWRNRQTHSVCNRADLAGLAGSNPAGGTFATNEKKPMPSPQRRGHSNMRRMAKTPKKRGPEAERLVIEPGQVGSVLDNLLRMPKAKKTPKPKSRPSKKG